MVRRYELFLPVDGDFDRSGLDLAASRAEPVVYAQVGVTAVDDKAHTVDHPNWAGTRWGDRTGNESAIGGPAVVNRVHRVPPDPPAVPEDAEAVFASPADYNSKSYYTVRWVPQTGLFSHVHRAMDGTLFDRDWQIRSTRASLDLADHEAFFPPEWPAGQRASAAAELNAISSSADYGGLSAAAVDLLGRLPGNEGFATSGGLSDRDWGVRRTRQHSTSMMPILFPPDWVDVLVRESVVDELNALASRDMFSELSNNGMRILAGLPGNEGAFRQVTTLPLLNSGPSTENRAGPDNPPEFAVDPTLRAYVDELDGRARNRYFYRTGFVDEAQNTSELGLSSPPVHLPNVLAPRRPVLIRALAGDPEPAATQDRKITLAWASNREPDLASYRVYRTAISENARDTRLMDVIAEIPVAAGEPRLRPEEVLHTDEDIAGLVTFTYCVEAVDSGGNRSLPSEPIAARAFDTTLPEIPDVTIGWVDQGGTVRAQLSWTSEHEVMVQRRQGVGPWIDLAQWRAPGDVTVRDPFSETASAYSYRLLVRKYTGARRLGASLELDPLGA